VKCADHLDAWQSPADGFSPTSILSAKDILWVVECFVVEDYDLDEILGIGSHIE
jgi:hypothetical protein